MSEQTKLTGPAPGFIEHPAYRVEMAPSSKRVCVTLGGETIADSANALLMLETNHDPVYYFPRADLRMDLMERTDHTSF